MTSGPPPPDDEDRWDWLWTTLKVLAWAAIGLIAVAVLLFGICIAIFQFMRF